MKPDETGVVALARQPIFDSNHSLWGYQISCVADAGGLSPVDVSQERAMSCIASSAYVGLQELSRRGKSIVVALSQRAVLENLPYALPPSLAAVLVPETLGDQDDTLEVLTKLRSDGYQVAVRGFSAVPERRRLYEMADLFTISVVGTSAEALRERSARARAFKGRLLATEVSEQNVWSHCSKLGFDLFQGRYFKSPDQVPVRRMTSNEVTRMRLFGIIEQADPDFVKVAEAVQSDAALSYRLLAFLNSAAFGLSRRIGSIRQAITLLGWKTARNWLRVALLSDMAQGPGSPELVYLSAQRARFLELLGESANFWGFKPGTLQLLGLFSLLDVMLGLPMDEALRYLPLEEKVKQALGRDPDNEYLPLLQLAEALEEGKWGEAARRIQDLGLDEDGIRGAFQASVIWANQFGTVLGETPEKSSQGVSVNRNPDSTS